MSKNAENETNEPTNEPTFSGPGARLRALRESRDKKIEDVAKDTKLSDRLLTNLENDDYRDLHSEALAKGYLRAYAKWAGYSEAEIIQEFDANNLGTTIVSKKPQVIRDREAAIPPHKMRGLTFAVLGVLVVLILVWWHNHGNTNDKSIGSNVLPSDPSNTIATPAPPVVTPPPTSPAANQPIVQPLPIQKISNPKPARQGASFDVPVDYDPDSPKNMQDE